MPLFNNIKNEIFKGHINFVSDSFRVLLISGTTYDLNAVTRCDIDPDTIVGDPTGYPLQNLQLSRINHSDMIWTADDVVAPSLSGFPITQVIIYRDSGINNCAKDLLVWQKNATYEPDGTDLSIAWGGYIFNLEGKNGGDDFYYNGKLALFKGQIDMSGSNNDDIRVVLFNGYPAGGGPINETITDVIVDDLPFVSENAELKPRTVIDGAFDANDVVFSNITVPPIEGLAIVKWNSVDPQQSQLIAYFIEGFGLPQAPAAGSTLAIKWNNNPEQILCLNA